MKIHELGKDEASLHGSIADHLHAAADAHDKISKLNNGGKVSKGGDKESDRKSAPKLGDKKSDGRGMNMKKESAASKMFFGSKYSK